MRAPQKHTRRIGAITATAAAIALLTGAVYLGTDEGGDGDGATGRPGGSGANASVIEAPGGAFTPRNTGIARAAGGPATPGAPATAEAG
ncbi:hypothetical protein ABT084_09985 [Streptomyces sp. NPDC002138]|uniref:hypothetical protein n=1 Tax=Streptomyces sp. NPDC002138 TaxID=3154410 RepID=UPI003319A910